MGVKLKCDNPACGQEANAVVRSSGIEPPEGWTVRPAPGSKDVQAACSRHCAAEIMRLGGS